MAQQVKNLPATQKSRRFDPWLRKIPWGRKWQPTPVFLPGKPQGKRNLVGYSPKGPKELDMTEWLSTCALEKWLKNSVFLSTQLYFDLSFVYYSKYDTYLEKAMATHSSVLAWRIPGTREPGGLPSMESHSWTRLKRLSSSSSITHIPALRRNYNTV